jgi:hypothetical protein
MSADFQTTLRPFGYLPRLRRSGALLPGYLHSAAMAGAP